MTQITAIKAAVTPADAARQYGLADPAETYGIPRIRNITEFRKLPVIFLDLSTYFVHNLIILKL